MLAAQTGATLAELIVRAARGSSTITPMRWQRRRDLRSPPRTCPNTTASPCPCSWTSWRTSKTLSSADAIIVGIAHNSFALNGDQPCGTTFDEETNTLEDWSKVTAQCAVSSAAEYRPQYDELFDTIASWRNGKPTLLRTIDKYNDWNGWEAAHLTPGQVHRTVIMHDPWNRMLCESAERHGFVCADIYHAFNGEDGTKKSGDLLAADDTHPSDEGNERIARVLIAQGFKPLTQQARQQPLRRPQEDECVRGHGGGRRIRLGPG